MNVRPAGASATDLVLAGYCVATALLAALGGGALGARQLPLAAGPALVALVALALARAARPAAADGTLSAPGRRFLRFAHRWWPLVALAWLYGWAGELRHLLVGRDLDPWIEGWDEALLPGHWHLAGAQLPLPAIELAHAAYFSYYLLLFVPALAAGHERRRQVERYLFWLTVAMVCHYLLNLALPVAGPLAARAATMPDGVLFVPLMNWLYAGFDRGGLAFPSTHVVAAMLAAWFAGRRFFPRAAVPYALWFAAIAASTVLCGYHYPIDVLAGIATGALFVALAARAAPPEPAPPRSL